MKPTTLTAMRLAAQSAKSLPNYYLADAVIQLCDEVIKLTAALSLIAKEDYRGNQTYESIKAATALKESNERLGEWT